MPRVLLEHVPDFPQQLVDEIERSIRLMAAEGLSTSKRTLLQGDFSFRIRHFKTGDKPIHPVEVLIWADSHPERVARRDEVADGIRLAIRNQVRHYWGDARGTTYGQTAGVTIMLGPVGYSPLDEDD